MCHTFVSRRLLAAVLLATTACNAGDGDKPAEVFPTPSTPCVAPACQTIDIEAIEYAFLPQDVTVKAGKVRFIVRNTGKLIHNLRIIGGGLDSRSINLPAGKDGFLDVDVTARRYDLFCSITGHAERGMRGTLVAN